MVVTAPPPKASRERQAQAFVKRVPALNNGEALARWVKPICPIVAGMTEEQGEYVLLRLFQAARAAGAPVIDNGRCEVNAYVVATANPGELVKAWSRRNPAIFAGSPAEEVRQFLETHRPVRAWYTAHLDRETTSTESPFEGLEGLPRNIPVIHHADPSHLVSNSPYALTSAIVVVDKAQVSEMKVGPLADYLAMAVLTQLKPDAGDGGAPSILGLFSPHDGSEPLDGLTAWDRAFLHALYNTSLEDKHQGATIAIRMEQELSRPSPAP
jgi:hypothetical protein